MEVFYHRVDVKKEEKECGDAAGSLRPRAPCPRPNPWTLTRQTELRRQVEFRLLAI